MIQVTSHSYRNIRDPRYLNQWPCFRAVPKHGLTVHYRPQRYKRQECTSPQENSTNAGKPTGPQLCLPYIAGGMLPVDCGIIVDVYNNKLPLVYLRGKRTFDVLLALSPADEGGALLDTNVA